MDKNEVLSPEEQKADQEALVVAKEEEVKAAVIEEFGFDPAEDADLIEKAVAKEMKHRTELSQAIGQKIKYREKLNQKPPTEPQPPKKELPSEEDLEKKLDAKLEEKLAKRDLDSLDLPKE